MKVGSNKFMLLKSSRLSNILSYTPDIEVASPNESSIGSVESWEDITTSRFGFFNDIVSKTQGVV